MRKTEALDIFEDNLEEIAEAVEDNMNFKLEILSRPNPYITSFEDKVINDFVLAKEKMKVLQNFMPTLQMIAARKRKPVEGQITDLDIQRAKEYPLEELLDTKGRKGNISCPFHEDRTPSFQIRKDNTWNCYSCNEHGDAIDLYQKLNNVSFLEAVKALK